MRRNRAVKKWGAGLLAAAMTLGTFWQPLGAQAAPAEHSSDSYRAEGTFHIDQFGEYDILADVAVTEGIITGGGYHRGKFRGALTQM